jgi:hypothetical protein
MPIPSNIIIIKNLNRKNLNRAFVAGLMVAVFVFAAASAFAHGGFDHVMGTVVGVANNVLTVKTAKGNVDVKLDDKTELTRNGLKAQLGDLAPGARVVVDIPEGSKDRVAHSVKIGTANKAVEQHTHE